MARFNVLLMVLNDAHAQLSLESAETLWQCLVAPQEEQDALTLHDRNLGMLLSRGLCFTICSRVDETGRAVAGILSVLLSKSTFCRLPHSLKLRAEHCDDGADHAHDTLPPVHPPSPAAGSTFSSSAINALAQMLSRAGIRCLTLFLLRANEAHGKLSITRRRSTDKQGESPDSSGSSDSTSSDSAMSDDENDQFKVRRVLH